MESSSKFETSSSFNKKMMLADNQFTENYTRKNKIAKQAYRNTYGVDKNMDADLVSNLYIELPEYIYTNINEFPEGSLDDEGRPIHQYVQGNLASSWSSINNIR